MDLRVTISAGWPSRSSRRSICVPYSKGVIKEAQKVDLDKLERDIEEEGNRVAREKYKIFAG